ncbi:MAG: hypothetical protein ACKVP7_17580 [Hyphomicrobiaceae bacterium]
MAGTTKGFLLVMMQPPPAFEEEFNAWYDSEHIPERLSVPGFLTGLRYVAVSGHPRYLAMYDLESYAVLQSPAYNKVGYGNASPWTKRVTGRVKVMRYAGHQVVPGDRITKPSSRVQVLRFSGLKAGVATDLAQAVAAAQDGRAGFAMPRVLVHETGEHLVMTEMTAPIEPAIDVAALGAFAASLDLVNTYAPY